MTAEEGEDEEATTAVDGSQVSGNNRGEATTTPVSFAAFSIDDGEEDTVPVIVKDEHNKQVTTKSPTANDVGEDEAECKGNEWKKRRQELHKRLEQLHQRQQHLNS